MSDIHYTDDELLDRLYEAGRADDHLERCDECRVRWEGFVRRRREVLQPPPVADAWLRAQRALIHERIERPSPLRPALVFAALALLAVLLNRPAERPTSVVASSDAQLLSEIYTMIQDDEPRAAIPVRALFEARQ
jgi:hypothetical protein